MANKYIQAYATEATYNAATKELPNVSWIMSTNEVKYKPLTTGETVGDVLMWDVANQKLVATFNGNWDATTYPIASYVPIAVNVIPSSEASDSVTRWSSLNNLGSNSYGLSWGVGGVTIGGISNENSLSGRNYTDTVLNFSGYNATDYAAFNAVNTFVTSGTSAGDWYLPSLGELKLAYTHKDAINASLAAIHTASSSAASEYANNSYWSSTENSTWIIAGYAYYLLFSNGQASFQTKVLESNVRAFLML